MTNLYQKLNSKRQILVSVIIPILLVLVTLSHNSPSVAAWNNSTSPPQCAVPAALTGWDYKQKIRDVWPAWNPDTVQKANLVWETWSGTSGQTQTNFAYGDEIKFRTLNDGTLGVTRTITSSSNPSPVDIWPFRDFPGTANDSMNFMNILFLSDPAAGSYYHDLGNYNGTAVTTMTDNPILIGNFTTNPVNGGIKCISSGINVKYDPSYTGRHYDPLAVNNGLGSQAELCEGDWYVPWEKPAFS